MVIAANLPSLFRQATLWLALFTLTACGSGGGGGAPPAPVATPDTYLFPAPSTPITIPASAGVLTNDSGGPLTATLVKGPSFAASFTLNPDGSFNYTPNGSGNPDSFTYRAVNGSSSSVTTVTLTLNQPPVASNACLSTPANTALNGTLTATDELGSQPLTYAPVVDPAVGPYKGNVTIVPNGGFTYIPNTNFRGMDKFKFSAMDKYGSKNEAIVTVLIDGAVRIMPLGDSITEGVTTSQNPPLDQRVGYRKPLKDALVAAGFKIDFVGTLTNSSVLLPGDNEHDGHGGWSAYDIAFGHPNPDPGTGTGAVADWLNNALPDIVLLHIGTNDLNGSGDNSGVYGYVEAILAKIDTWEASHWPVTVILARIIKRDPAVLPNNEVQLFNDYVISQVAQPRINSGDRLIWVDQQAALVFSGDFASTLHPNSAGYQKMADVWRYPLAGTGTPTGSHPSGPGILPNCP